MLQCPYCNKAIPLTLFTAYLGSLSRGKTSERKKKSSRENGKLAEGQTLTQVAVSGPEGDAARPYAKEG